jgi:hypothetical protein
MDYFAPPKYIPSKYPGTVRLFPIQMSDPTKINTQGRGPFGSRSNNPSVDRDTLIRQQSQPAKIQCDSARGFTITAELTIGAARLVMDEYAREIFDLWFNGKAPDEVTFDNDRWSDYMSAEERLPGQINDQLTTHAEQLRDQVDKSSGRLQESFDLTFHAEVGKEVGGNRTGYNVLHGSNKEAGDFVITGRFTAVRSGPAGGAYVVTYDNLEYTFNDIVDINKKYSSDVTLGRMARNMAVCLKTGPPKDYTLHIKWQAGQPIKISVKAGTTGLKQFPNK